LQPWLQTGKWQCVDIGAARGATGKTNIPELSFIWRARAVRLRWGQFVRAAAAAAAWAGLRRGTVRKAPQNTHTLRAAHDRARAGGPADCGVLFRWAEVGKRKAVLHRHSIGDTRIYFFFFSLEETLSALIV
jgi:hypothetical protein